MRIEVLGDTNTKALIAEDDIADTEHGDLTAIEHIGEIRRFKSHVTGSLQRLAARRIFRQLYTAHLFAFCHTCCSFLSVTFASSQSHQAATPCPFVQEISMTFMPG